MIVKCTGLFRWRTIVFVIVGLVFLLLYKNCARDKAEISLILGEPWGHMQERSTAKIGQTIPGRSWYRIPKTDARLRLADKEYEFVTPLARFFTIAFTPEGTIRSVRMSPQIEPLLIEDTMKILMDLQGQWRRKGWTLVDDIEFPAVEDTMQWRNALRENRADTTYWVAGDKYQVMVFAHRFTHPKRPYEERYLITLELAPPMWVD